MLNAHIGHFPLTNVPVLGLLVFLRNIDVLTLIS